MTYVYFHLFVKLIVHDQTMSHSYPMGFHRMSSDIGIVTHVRIVKVCHAFFICSSRSGRIKWGDLCTHD